MRNGKWPSGKWDGVEMPEIGKWEMGNGVVNLPFRDIFRASWKVLVASKLNHLGGV